MDWDAHQLDRDSAPAAEPPATADRSPASDQLLKADRRFSGDSCILHAADAGGATAAAAPPGPDPGWRDARAAGLVAATPLPLPPHWLRKNGVADLVGACNRRRERISAFNLVAASAAAAAAAGTVRGAGCREPLPVPIDLFVKPPVAEVQATAPVTLIFAKGSSHTLCCTCLGNLLCSVPAVLRMAA